MRHQATRPCVDCGRPTERTVRADREWVCVTCAERRVEANIRQLRAKRGPYARRWRAGLQRWAMGLQVADEDPEATATGDGTAAAS